MTRRNIGPDGVREKQQKPVDDAPMQNVDESKTYYQIAIDESNQIELRHNTWWGNKEERSMGGHPNFLSASQYDFQ